MNLAGNLGKHYSSIVSRNVLNAHECESFKSKSNTDKSLGFFIHGLQLATIRCNIYIVMISDEAVIGRKGWMPDDSVMHVCACVLVR